MSTPHVLAGRRGQLAATALAAATLLNATLFGTGPHDAVASSHREAPLIANDPAVDNTDLYAFVSPDHQDTVTIVANFSPFQEPNGGPNFYPWANDARYDINIDNDGDARPDLTFRWTFETEDKRQNKTFLYNDGQVTSLDDENLLFKQKYKLEVIDMHNNKAKLVYNGKVAPSNTGPASMPDYKVLRDQAITHLQGGAKVYVGPADDSFFLDLRVFDLLYGGNLSEVGQDTLRGFNVNTIALQVPKDILALNGKVDRNPNVGIWSTTERRSLKLEPGKAKAEGDFVQVSRLGNPLVNEVVAPAGLKDAFNGLEPKDDAKVKDLLDRVVNPELPKLIEGIYKIPAPPGPRNDLSEIFLTGVSKKVGDKVLDVDLNSQLNNADVDQKRFQAAEMLRLNMSVPVTQQPNRLGVIGGDLQGFPNGRRLTDDVVDIALQAVEGAAASGKLVDALAAGDKVDQNDVGFENKFPYVALPRNEAVNAGGAQTANVAPAGFDGTIGKIAMPTALGAVALFGFGYWLWRKRQDHIRKYGAHSAK
ncbi:hypothetical protein Lesp02_81960 [Lentzea sp. NBRC 105346]|uniref:DUF4331 domain-containing protein n=1 Tax=Lentzea sp. NBRC 105346 TaxID=3032205 RepID=UPI0024A5588E|nr:DUF4331 domain-containing protein [Lentzea sp. NBRC 105346]GLZ36009.1 hypothetical protein Lesp02_81960 [Lentzea sp. NBRC 105346]